MAQNFAERVLQRLDTNNVQEALRIAARDTVVEMGDRIFQEGKNASGGKIGEYSTNPLTMLKTDMPRKVSGTSESDDSVFFEGGYREYKKKLRGNSLVNWRNFGTLMRDFYSPKETLKGNSIKLTVKTPESQEKLDYLDDHFKGNGEILALSQAEKDNFQRVFTFELQKRLFVE